jgi:hypothetical protein
MAATTAKTLHRETVNAGAVLKDPRDQGPKGPHPAQTQDGTGRESEMTPLADHGEGSYQGHDRLLGRVALITGGRQRHRPRGGPGLRPRGRRRGHQLPGES